MKFWFLSTIVLLPMVVQAQTHDRASSLTGNIQHLPPFHSNVLQNDRNITVYLPPDYETSKDARYPVLYMADGQNVFDGMTSFIPNQEWRADESAEALIQAKAIQPIIIVAIDNAGAARADEFLPSRAKLGKDLVGGNADKYGDMLIKEIKPLVDKTYRTKRGRNDTALGGSSFGGIITLYLGLTHPEVFSKLVVCSPSIWWDNQDMLKRLSALPAKLPLKIWMDYGTEEGPMMSDGAKQAAATLQSKGWVPGKDLLLFEDKGAQHNEKAWSHRFPIMLMYMFSK